MLTRDGRSPLADDRDPTESSLGAISTATIATCFAGLEGAGALLLAVSGGPDSIALLLMAARWVRRLGAMAPAVHVATVDHGLRLGSRSEAEMVAALAARHEMPHAILTWTGPKPSTRVQERARAARYTLLADQARSIGATEMLTAHHADDQAETVLMRLGRGSGIGGLAGIRHRSPLQPGITLVRPLLGLTKAHLIACCRAEGCDYVDDPSNRDPAYARARLRAEASALAQLGLDTAGLTRLARRMARADAALEVETDRVEAALAPERAGGAFRTDLTPVAQIAREIGLRLVRRALSHVAGDAPLRLEQLEVLTDALWGALHERQPHGATLAGARVTLDRDGVLKVWAESPRRRSEGPSRRRD